jgi:hypothetical protein
MFLKLQHSFSEPNNRRLPSSSWRRLCCQTVFVFISFSRQKKGKKFSFFSSRSADSVFRRRAWKSGRELQPEDNEGFAKSSIVPQLPSRDQFFKQKLT